MARMVLLHHELPDGTSHYDWLIEPASFGPGAAERAWEPDDRCLIAFRVVERIDRPKVERFEADKIGNHRYAYLDYQGPVSGNRGTVTRAAHGLVRKVEEGPDVVRVRGKFTSGTEHVWTGLLRDGLWHFQRGPRIELKSKPGQPFGPDPGWIGGDMGSISF